MKLLVKFAACVAALASIFACNTLEAPQLAENQVSITKAVVDNSPILSVYVETNDVNPLNAGDYYLEMSGGSFIDIVELFAANIHKETVNGVTRPTLFLNDKLASRAKNEGYGAMMCFNLRTRNDKDPLPIFQAISNGAYGGQTVACDDGNRSRDVVINPNGFTITYDMALTWLAE